MYVEGYKPADKKWQEMKAVWDTCEDAGINVPDAVWDYFNGEPPDEAGVLIKIGKMDCVVPYKADMHEGFDVLVSKLPKDVTMIRFYCSW
jgi:hypothetical protein